MLWSVIWINTVLIRLLFEKNNYIQENLSDQRLEQLDHWAPTFIIRRWIGPLSIQSIVIRKYYIV